MSSPKLLLSSLELVRGLLEYTSAVILKSSLEYLSPKGDGHPVIIFPGLAASDGSLNYLRTFLDDIGYKTYSWGQGYNFGPREGINPFLEKLQKKLAEVYAANGNRKVTLIGWSLGGIYVRELAKLNPEMVRNVITLGTPFRPDSTARHVTFLYEFFSKDTLHKDPAFWKQLKVKPPVPFTSVYSKSDGIVHWEASIEEVTEISENVEVPISSHVGLVTNPFVMRVIADRLSQPEGGWEPYKT